jgi:hypothetical protein
MHIMYYKKIMPARKKMLDKSETLCYTTAVVIND